MSKINDNHKKFCEEYVLNGYKGGPAYKVVYQNNNANTCRVEAYKLLKLPKIRDYIEFIEGSYRAIGKEVGINKESILEKIKGMLQAEKPIYFQGRLIESIPDWTAINAAITTYAKLVGDFAPEESKITLEEGTDVDLSKLTDEEKEVLKTKILKEL